MENSKILKAIASIFIYGLIIIFLDISFANNQRVKIGLGQNPPLTVRNADSAPTGLAIDVIQDVAKIEGWQVEFVEDGWSNLLKLLEDGEIDVLTGITHSKKRAERYDFSSEPIIGNWGVVYRQPSIKVDSILDLSGLRIAMGPKGAHAIALVKLLNDFGLNYSIVETKSYIDVFDKLESGAADVGVVSHLFGITEVKSRKIVATGINFNPVKILFASPNGRGKDLLAAIDRYLISGKNDPNSTYQTHLEQWVDASTENELPPWILWVIILFSFCLFISISFVWLLRRQVRLKTKKLQISESRFDQAMEASRDGIYDWNLETNEIYYSPGWKLMLGYQDDELPNDFSVWENLVNPEDVKRSWQMQDDLINQKRDRFELEFKMKHKNGHWVDVLSRAKALFDDTGNPIRIVGTHVDITKRKAMEVQLYEKERALRLSLDAGKAGTWTWDIKSGEVIWDNRMQDIFGLKPGSFDSTFEAWKKLVHPDDIDSAEKATLDALKNKKGYDHEYRVKAINGEWRIVNAQAAVLRDEKGDPIRMSGLATDITESRKNEQEILRHKTILEKAQQIGQIGSWDLDVLNNNLTWTDQTYKIFEIPLETNLTYETFLGCIHPEDMDDVDGKWKTALRGNPYDIEHRILVNDKVKWVRQKAEFEFDGNGTCFKGTGFTQDITDRKTMEIDLAASRDRFEKVFNSQPDAIFMLNAQVPAVVMQCNKAATDIFRYSPQEMIGSDVSFLHKDTDSLKTFQNKLFPAIETDGIIKDFVFSMKRKNGEIFPSEHTVLEIKDDDGNRTGWLSIVRDLSEMERAKINLIESENKFEILYNKSPLSYQSLDPNGDLLEVNETWLKLLGYEKAEVIGKNFSEFLTPEWKDNFKNNFPILKSIGEVLGVEFELVKKDGSIILISLNGAISRDEDGNFIRSHCVFNDVTKQRQFELEKENMEKRMNQIQRIESIGNLAGGIAHDFNNILFPIVGMSEMLLEDLPDDSPEHENAQEIYYAGTRGAELVKQILSFSRQQEHKMIPIKIQTILQEAIKLIRSTIPSNIKIQQDIDSKKGLVLADSTQIHQVAMNLITNAYHAVSETDGVINIELNKITVKKNELPFTSLIPGDYMKLSVSDNGTGIDSHLLNRIFEPYFTTKEKGKGTGLGLSVVHGIVKEHNGEIKVYSEKGKGTTFSVYLPVIMEKSSEKIKSNENEMQKGTERILFVDDETSVAKLGKQILERLGYRVEIETDSTTALNFFREDPDKFDLIISDMSMPNLTGDRFAKEILAIKPNMPIIICTGFSERINEKQAQAIGIKGFLMKPVVRSEMAQMVRKVLESQV